MDSGKVAASFAFDPEQVAELHARWLALLDLAVWGDLKSVKIGAVPRLRKRLLELGEHLRSLVSDRSWIPQAREQVKGAMGASLNLRESLLNLERVTALLEGGADFSHFEQGLLDFRGRLLTLMERHEALWGDLLESQYREDDAPEG